MFDLNDAVKFDGVVYFINTVVRTQTNEGVELTYGLRTITDDPVSGYFPDSDLERVGWRGVMVGHYLRNDIVWLNALPIGTVIELRPPENAKPVRGLVTLRQNERGTMPRVEWTKRNVVYDSGAVVEMERFSGRANVWTVVSYPEGI